VRLDGRVALITGAGRGIGAAVAAELSRRGASVFLVARTRHELEEVAARVRAEGGRVSFAAADVSRSGELNQAVEGCTAEFGAPHIAVAAAGVYGPIGRSWEVSVEAWWRAQEINVLGTVLTARATIRPMLERGWGRIISFSGGGAATPLPRFSAYAASKAAVVRFTETLAEEVRGTGVTANAIAPGAVDTRLQDEVLAAGEAAGELLERIRQLREEGSGGVPPEVAASLAAFLASDAAAALTGKLISAPHDDWRNWNEARMAELGASAWLTLRRLDDFTLRPLLPGLESAGT
jgi:NAD(P)-dependent dehydrogenase (short-subunit alcohol dehydrogenase family)